MRIDLSRTPQFNTPKSMHFGPLSGGLNLRDLGYLVDGDESPCMKNLMWRDGLLQSRDGQRKVAEVSSAFDNTKYRKSYAVTDTPFHGYSFFHVGNTLQCLQTDVPLEESDGEDPVRRCNVLTGDIAPNRGTFFQYQGKLFYKNLGGFYVIEYTDVNGTPGGHVAARFNVYRENLAQGKQYFSLFKLDGSDYVRVNSLSDVVTGDYIIREKDSGRLFAATNLPDAPGPGEEPSITYSGSIVAEGVDRVPASGVWYTARLHLERPSGTNKIQLTKYNGNVLWYVLGASPNGPRVAEGKADFLDDTHFKWLLRDTEDCPAGHFRLINLGMTRDTGADYSAFYSPEAVLDPAPFTVTNLADVADDPDNAPVILINSDPRVRGSGDLYQPENRMSYNKTVWFNATWFNEQADPPQPVSIYRLPVQGIGDVLKVTVNDEVVDPSHYTVYKQSGNIQFAEGYEPVPSNPAVNNTVKITYRKANTDVKWAVLDCPYATVAGGGDSAQYIVVGGCAQQPDAIFWNANDELAIQPWYFPEPCYNFLGAAGDAVTGFGRQYNDTLVFGDHTVGKLTYSTQTVDGRVYPAFGYERVNDRIGCDLPWTIRTVENNVVFCNTYAGVHIVLSSSAAYENNIQELSQKIRSAQSSDGSSVDPLEGGIKGLLQDIRDSVVDVLSFDDGERYWLCVQGKVYVWDYGISTYADPSWFYWNHIPTRGLFHDQQHNVYSLDRTDSAIQRFMHVNNDNGNAIDKIYQFPTLNFGTYERLKDVTDVVAALRSDVPSTVSLRYDTDYETRFDLTPLVVSPGNGLTISGRRLVQPFKRRPKCRHVRQFGLTLRNNTAGEDLALVSMQIFYCFNSNER